MKCLYVHLKHFPFIRMQRKSQDVNIEKPQGASVTTLSSGVKGVDSGPLGEKQSQS